MANILSEYRCGANVRLRSMSCGGATNSRLRAMGLFPNCSIQVLHRNAAGAMVILVGRTRMALDEQITRALLVHSI